MGRRYVAILKYLGVDHLGVDVSGEEPTPGAFTDVSHVIIATPTDTHCNQVVEWGDLEVPILVEKPLATNMEDVLETTRYCERRGVRIRMVNQYRFCWSSDIRMKMDDDHTVYDYFNTGKDGKYWDAISIIGLAQRLVSIRTDSPHWFCKINGRILDIEGMDHAYVKMVKNFIEHPPLAPETDYIVMAHQKVQRMIDIENSDRNPS
jgi:hypothetical protein